MINVAKNGGTQCHSFFLDIDEKPEGNLNTPAPARSTGILPICKPTM